MCLKCILQYVSLPNIHLAAGPSRVQKVWYFSIRRTHHGLVSSSITESTSFGGESTPCLCPEFNVFHSSSHKTVSVMWIPLDNKDFVFVAPRQSYRLGGLDDRHSESCGKIAAASTTLLFGKTISQSRPLHRFTRFSKCTKVQLPCQQGKDDYIQ